MDLKAIALWAGSAAITVFGGAIVSLLSKETESMLGAAPAALLKLAKRRAPVSIREELYEDWLADLYEAVNGTDDRPLTRLLFSLKFSWGILRSARQIGISIAQVRSRHEPARPSADRQHKHDASQFAEIAEAHVAIFTSLAGHSASAWIRPTTYRDARNIGEYYRKGSCVVLDMTELDDADARRLVDFSAGLAFASQGSMMRVSHKVFVLSPGSRREPVSA